jgi:branched-chain amino acid transport system substrate-binding protein
VAHHLFFKSLLAGALLLAGAATAAAAEPIRIGSVLSLSGPAAFLGAPELKTLQIYIAKINAEGGVLGRKLELVEYDDASRSDKADGLTRRLIGIDKVDIIIGGSTTGATMTSMPLVEKAGMPFISLAGAAGIVEPARKWVFKTPQTDRMAAEKVFGDMQKRGITRIGLLSESSGFGLSGRKEARGLAAKYGITLVADESFGRSGADSSAQLARIGQAPDVQAIFVYGLGQGAAAVTKNYSRLGLKMPLYQSHAVASDDFISMAGMSSEGVRMPSSAILVASTLPDDDPQKSVVTDYGRLYREKFKDEPSSFGGYAYDALALYLDAVKRAGSTAKDKVRLAMEQTRGFVGATGIFSMSATDHLGLDSSAFRMVEVINADWHLVKPN